MVEAEEMEDNKSADLFEEIDILPEWRRQRRLAKTAGSRMALVMVFHDYDLCTYILVVLISSTVFMVFDISNTLCHGLLNHSLNIVHDRSCPL